MKIIFLDVKTIGEDINLSKYEQLGEVIKYPFSTPKEASQRTVDADIVITNKVPINETTIGNAEKLKLVCVTATGTNNLDKDYLTNRGIEWRNAAGYSTDSVTQHTFAMLFYLLEKLKYYDDYVKDDKYTNDVIFTHFAETFTELRGKTFGIIGLGNIGRKVADVARAFGAKVIYYSASGAPKQDGYEQVDLDTLLSTSDIVSVHAPLNEHTENLMNLDNFKKMKPSSIFLNLGRGPIVVEEDLRFALDNNIIKAAGLDVLCIEPMSINNPLRGFNDSRKLFITPHIAWASVEARERLMDILYNHITNYFTINTKKDDR